MIEGEEVTTPGQLDALEVIGTVVTVADIAIGDTVAGHVVTRLERAPNGMVRGWADSYHRTRPLFMAQGRLPVPDRFDHECQAHHR